MVIHDNKVLLIKRGIPPSKGLWAIPGGGLELGETLAAAAEREIQEETGIVINAQKPIYTFEVLHRDDDNRVQYHYIVVDMLAEYISGEPCAADDAVDARWLSWEEIKLLPVSQNTIKLLETIGFSR